MIYFALFALAFGLDTLQHGAIMDLYEAVGQTRRDPARSGLNNRFCSGCNVTDCPRFAANEACLLPAICINGDSPTGTLLSM